MIDLFGLGKHSEAQEPEGGAPPEPAEPHAPSGSHKLWAFLLVLDSVFVIVFAGAVAAKIYQYWNAAPAPVAQAPRRRAAAPPVPAVATAPLAAAPIPEPVKPAPEPAKPAPKAAEGQRPPKPSMLSEAPRHRETPKLAESNGKTTPAPKPAAAPAAAAADGKVKALKTEFKVRAPKAKAVELVGAFIVRGGRKEMTREDDGTWTVTLYLNPGSYRYFFSVDKKKQLDPENPHSEKGASLLTIP
jgi:hypothetical protein